MINGRNITCPVREIDGQPHHPLLEGLRVACDHVVLTRARADVVKPPVRGYQANSLLSGTYSSTKTREKS